MGRRVVCSSGLTQVSRVVSKCELACMSSCLAHDPVGNVGSKCVRQSYPATSCQVEEYTSALPEAVHQFSVRLPPEIGGSLDAQLPQLRVHLVAGPRSTLHPFEHGMRCTPIYEQHIKTHDLTTNQNSTITSHTL